MDPATFLLQHERVDDLPLLFGLLDQLQVAEILDRHLGTHHLHQGLSNGQLACAWLAFILSEADHRKSTVQDWAQRHDHTLQVGLGQELRPAEFSDDRLGIVRRRLHEAAWPAVEADLGQATCEVYEVPLECVRLDSTTSYGYHETTPEGLLQLGHSKDHRPDLPQLQLMAAAAQPAGHLLACDLHPGNAADDPLYVPLATRVRQQLQRTGLLYVGDGKMAALATRADLVAHGDFYLMPLPHTSDTAAEFATWVNTALAEPKQLQRLYRTAADGTKEASGRG